MWVKKSARFISPGYWECPTDVKLVYINFIGAGGGGAYDIGINAGAGGGGGELAVKFPIPVVPGTVYFVQPGEGGTRGFGIGASGNINGTDGNSTIFNGFSALGGQPGWQDGAGTLKSDGGGPNGAQASLAGATNGTAESPVHFGGTSGGATSGSTGVFGGQAIGQYDSPAGTGSNPGSSGGATLWTKGARGGDNRPDPGHWGVMGAGGGGGCSAASSSAPTDGGNGGSGIVEIFWVG